MITERDTNTCVVRDMTTVSATGFGHIVPNFSEPVSESAAFPSTTQARNEADAINILALPSPSQFRSWKLTLRYNVAGACGALSEGFVWIIQAGAPG